MKLIRNLLVASVLGASLLSATPHTLDNSHSSVEFKVKHLMISNVKGDFKNFSGVIDFDYKTTTFNKFEGVVETASVDTGIVKRDNHLRSGDFFLSEKYPTMVFKMKKYISDGDEGQMQGDITIRGVTKPMTFDVEDIGTVKDFNGNNRVGFTLKGKINRTDFGLKWNKALEFGGFAVGEKVKITVEVEAVEE